MSALTTKDQDFLATYFKDVHTAPLKMLIQAISLMFAGVFILISAGIITTTGEEITLLKFKWVMLPGIVLSIIAAVPGFLMFRKWRTIRDLSRLHDIIQKVDGISPATTPKEAPSES